MTTKKLYKILDNVLPPNRIYNLHKLRNVNVWRVRAYNSNEFDQKAIMTWAEGLIFPDVEDFAAEFVRICEAI